MVATYGIPFVSGRDVTVLDQASEPTVAIVNEAFVRRYFAGRNPIGQTIREVGPENRPPASTVVGLVKDAVDSSLREVAPPIMYVPSAFGSSLSVRTDTGSPGDLARSVRAAIAAIDQDLSLTIRPLANDFTVIVARERILALLSGFFGGLALLLSAIGLFGVVSYGVGARRAEIGIRLALGASQFSVVGLVVRRVAVLVAAGLIVGLPVSIWSARLVSGLLFGLHDSDPTTYLSAVALLVAVGGAGAWAPARRAARINPAITLRAE
ncbi:MAG: FtsX-like permease family protein [Acidobacteriota bacterium]